MALIIILITIGVINDKKKDERNAQLILNPQVGDVFEVKIMYKRYTLYKVEEVRKDSVFFQVSTYEVNKKSGIDDLKKKPYSVEVYGLSISEIQAMLKKGGILDIDRK